MSTFFTIPEKLFCHHPARLLCFYVALYCTLILEGLSVSCNCSALITRYKMIANY